MRSKFKLVVFDLDGTLVDCWSSWVFVHDRFGVDNSASLDLYIAGEIDDMEFMRRDIALWMARKPGVTKAHIDEILCDIKTYKGARKLMSMLREGGSKTAIISGGLKSLALRVAKDLRIDYVMANDLATDEDGRLLGHGLLEVELNRKRIPMGRLLKRLKVGKEDCAAVGNSFIDAPMLKMAALGIAFNPTDEQVKEGADVIIESADMMSLAPYLFSGIRARQAAARRRSSRAKK